LAFLANRWFPLFNQLQDLLFIGANYDFELHRLFNFRPGSKPADVEDASVLP
jgi:hypothetical protein